MEGETGVEGGTVGETGAEGGAYQGHMSVNDGSGYSRRNALPRNSYVSIS